MPARPSYGAGTASQLIRGVGRTSFEGSTERVSRAWTRRRTTMRMGRLQRPALDSGIRGSDLRWRALARSCTAALAADLLPRRGMRMPPFFGGSSECRSTDAGRCSHAKARPA